MTAPFAWRAEVAARIQAERKRLGKSIQQAATEAGMRRQSYQSLERTANPTLSTLAALCQIGMDPRRIAPELFTPLR